MYIWFVNVIISNVEMFLCEIRIRELMSFECVNMLVLYVILLLIIFEFL